ncbi:MAG: STAS/SEC14 domain-containing protein [Deltaproteobacteria bacterium]|nr:STAS/SEC14 domain-containing protein [Deltaproteobacteria bacterium]
MNTKIISADDVVLIRWGTVTVEGIEKAEALVNDLKKKGGKVGYYAVVPGTAPIPDEAARKRMGESLKVLGSICENINLVFEGRGLKIAAARSVAASIFLVQGNRKMFMFSTLEEALQKQRPTDAAKLCAVAQEAGIYVATPT